MQYCNSLKDFTYLYSYTYIWYLFLYAALCPASFADAWFAHDFNIFRRNATDDTSFW